MRKLIVFLFIYFVPAYCQITGFWGVRYLPEADSPTSLVSNSYGHIFYAGWSLWRSIDQGNTWTKLSAPGRVNGHVIVDLNDNLYLVGGYGVWFSTDNGGTWEDPSHIISDSYRITMSSNGTIFVTGTRDGAGIYRSLDSARSWTKVFSDSSLIGVGAIHANPFSRTVIAVESKGLGKRLLRSTDNGDNWTALKLEDTTWTTRAFASDSSGNIFAITAPPDFGVYSTVRKSTDDGLNLRFAFRGSGGHPGLLRNIPVRRPDGSFAGTFEYVLRRRICR